MPAHGSCLCGAIHYDVDGPLRAVINCHCGQCRKWTGHHVAATAGWRRQVSIHDPERALSWYRSSDHAARGFCDRCGSSLFWQLDDAETITIMAGTVDGQTGLRTEANIYVDNCGDYYTRGDNDVPSYDQSGHGVEMPKDS